MDTSIFFWKPNNVKSAIAAKMTPLSVDFDAKTGVFPSSRGNKTYVCTLEQCPCTDFSINRKPCKHMIRLAHELHVITLDGVQTSIDAAQEKQSLSIADELASDASLQGTIYICKAADALLNGEVISDEQLSALRRAFPYLITEKGTINHHAMYPYEVMRTKLSKRLGLLLVDHIDALSDEFIDTLCWLDDPTFVRRKQSEGHDEPADQAQSERKAKKADHPSVSMDNLLSQLTQKGISYKDLRAQGGCLWVESTGRADALLKGISVDGFCPVLVPESRHFSGRRAWYIK